VKTSKMISHAGTVPFLGKTLRRIAGLYREGSVVTVKSGPLAGYKWKRSHRYVNGYWLGIYELPIQECLVRELGRGDVFYDIGANAGFFSLLAARQVGSEGRVFAFDPLPDNADTIRTQFALNGLSNSVCVEAAVSSDIGEVRFSPGRDTSTAHMAASGDPTSDCIAVHATTLDTFVASNPHPTFIKIDVEGAEAMVLRGATCVVTGEHAPRLLIELHGNEVAEECRSFLEACGYRFFGLTREPVSAGALPHHVLALPVGEW